MRRRGVEDGFTLVELLVVLGIIGILTSIALPSLASQKTKARGAAMRATLRAAVTAEETIATDGLPYAPAGATGLALLRAYGYHDTDGVTLTVLAGDAGSYCLMAATDDVAPQYVSNAGADAGRITRTACA